MTLGAAGPVARHGEDRGAHLEERLVAEHILVVGGVGWVPRVAGRPKRLFPECPNLRVRARKELELAAVEEALNAAPVPTEASPVEVT